MRTYISTFTVGILVASCGGAPVAHPELAPVEPVESVGETRADVEPAACPLAWVPLPERLLGVEFTLTLIHRRQLRGMLEDLEAAEVRRVRVIGYGCPSETSADTFARADLVASALVEIGVDGDMIETIGVGAPRACCTCEPPGAAAKNCQPCTVSPVESRRVELEVAVPNCSEADGAVHARSLPGADPLEEKVNGPPPSRAAGRGGATRSPRR